MYGLKPVPFESAGGACDERESWGDAVVFVGEAGSGVEGVDFGEDFRPLQDGWRVLADLAGHLGEDAMDLSLLIL